MSSFILNSRSNKNMEIVIELAKKLNIEVKPISPKERQRIEDRNLYRMMQEARKEGFADTDEMLREMGLKQ